MTSKTLLRISLVCAALVGNFAVLASAQAATQTHHCKMADGSMDMSKTHKACTAAKGKWVKDAPAAGAATPAPAASATPKK